MTQPPPPRHHPARPRRSGRRGGDSGTREAILAAARSRFGDYGYDGATIRGIAADAGVDAALVHHFFGTKERLFAAAMRLPLIPGEVVAAALAPGAREPDRGLGEHLLRTVLGAWDVAEMRSTFLGLLRSAVTSEQAAGMLREFATEAILSRIAGAAQAAAGNAGPHGAGSQGTGPGSQGTWPDGRGTGARSQGTGAGSQGTGPDGRGTGPDGGRAAAGADAQFRAALVASQVLGLALTRYVLELDPLVRADVDELATAIGPTLERYLTGQVD